MAIKYDNCKDCHSRCMHAGKDREFICINGVSCKITKANPQSNADRIRSMSDEELAKQFSHTSICEQKYPKCMIAGEECAECLLEWLKQPAE